MAAGAWFGPVLLAGRSGPTLERRNLPRWALGVAGLLLLVNLPLIVTLPRGYTPRTFTPTWLVLDVVAVTALSRLRWKGRDAVFMVVLVATALFVWLLGEETKGRALEEIAGPVAA